MKSRNVAPQKKRLPISAQKSLIQTGTILIMGNTQTAPNAKKSGKTNVKTLNAMNMAPEISKDMKSLQRKLKITETVTIQDQ